MLHWRKDREAEQGFGKMLSNSLHLDLEGPRVMVFDGELKEEQEGEGSLPENPTRLQNNRVFMLLWPRLWRNLEKEILDSGLS